MLTIPEAAWLPDFAIRQASIPGAGLSFTALPSVCLRRTEQGRQ